MRKIRGWIKNLGDGESPAPGTVEVAAKVDDVKLNLETHDLGYLDFVHLTGGASSADVADASGHFGWDMELSPGPITQEITPSDPQTEYRWRFPDESAQVGKAFHSDLERLGWTAGRDCLVWGAIEGVTPPTPAQWTSGDPLVTSTLGDWSIDTSTAAANPGRVTLRRGIGFLGGVVFSIEHGDLLVPLLSEPAAAANGAGTDRWDLLVLAMDIADPNAATYGKQSIYIQQGGATIPTLAPRAGYRLMAIHALKMAAGTSVYSAATDLREWDHTPPGMSGADPIARAYVSPSSPGAPGTAQVVSDAIIPSILNTQLASDEVLLPLGRRWTGRVDFSCVVTQINSGNWLYLNAFTEGRAAVGGPVVTVPSSDYIVRPAPGFHRFILPVGVGSHQVSTSWPLRVIPGFSPSPLTTEQRSWGRLRFGIQMTMYFSFGVVLYDQHLNIHLWPVP